MAYGSHLCKKHENLCTTRVLCCILNAVHSVYFLMLSVSHYEWRDLVITYRDSIETLVKGRRQMLTINIQVHAYMYIVHYTDLEFPKLGQVVKKVELDSGLGLHIQYKP